MVCNNKELMLPVGGEKKIPILKIFVGLLLFNISHSLDSSCVLRK